ncbi:MAG: hypothetical protein HY959_09010 [Ignavibacteriae bacterium]|nr:hypothetical protein [Ignavibacteriota bacterium]
MSRDFTIEKMLELLIALKSREYSFVTFEDFISRDIKKAVILRHDVDKLPGNSLKFAELQNELGISGTYYFRIVKESFNPGIIKKIASLGHEIGYHYEDLTLAKGDIDKAFESYRKNLEKLREFYPVQTICMHGSPLTKWDNKDIWKKYSYRETGITGEPYFDLDFRKVYYITDTGRKWDGGGVSVRDKVNSDIHLKFRTTNQIIEAVLENKFPDVAMFTLHPQRWTNNAFEWTNELLKQNVKNIVKKVIVKRKNEL